MYTLFYLPRFSLHQKHANTKVQISTASQSFRIHLQH